jgi:hypothetical protein
VSPIKPKNKKLTEEIEKEAVHEKKVGIDKISNELIEEIKIKSEGDKANALEKAVKDLVDFIESGGEVDFIMPADNEEETDNSENKSPDYSNLKLYSQEIRILESKLRSIETKGGRDDDEST